jgi:dihydroorotate dehydrogenase (NAD+) catalytic subunit
MVECNVKIGKTIFKNPVWAASGTFGNGEEFKDFLDLTEIGAVVTKTITLNPRQGNPTPRVIETPSGLLNSIGLENKGVEYFAKEQLPFLQDLGVSTIVSIAGETPEEFVQCAEKLMSTNQPDAIELNLSCPNVNHKGTGSRLFAQDPEITENITREVKNKTGLTVITKLTPNVTDIGKIARAAEKGGADAVSLVNTYFGMAVDAEEMKPVLGNVTGGVSGPAIKPMALRAVWDVYNEVTIPVIGIGGIMTGIDAAEFILAGASAIQVGTANFVDPARCSGVLKELKEYLERKKIKSTMDLVGKLKV